MKKGNGGAHTALSVGKNRKKWHQEEKEEVVLVVCVCGWEAASNKIYTDTQQAHRGPPEVEEDAS